jgi:two-component system response regulator HydG
MAGRVLVVDDDRAMCDLLETDLRLRGLQAQTCHRAQDALRALKEGPFDVVLTDVRMPGTSGLQLCEEISRSHGDTPVIVMTAFGNMETAIDALRAGAYDFITKPVEMDLLAAAIRRAIQKHQLQEQVRLLSETVDRASHFGEIIGDSPALQSVFHQLAQLAPTDSTVLLTGESGTGKELVARCIHRRSRRDSGPFVAINCAAIPEALLESELFGHAKGAFTDARADRKGLWEQADGGTLLLDEIGDMPLSMQAKILRALESGVIRPVGSDRDVPVDVRIIAATNRDLEAAVESGTFRPDLYYRVNVFQIELPPLRSRGADILLLAQHFIKTFAEKMEKAVVGLGVAVAQKLMAYNWPGNVRELRNVIERAVALTQFSRLEVEDLPEKIRDFDRGRVLFGGDDPKELVSLEEVQRRYIAHVLEATGGNQSQAARILGVDRKTLYRKRKEE